MAQSSPGEPDGAVSVRRIADAVRLLVERYEAPLPTPESRAIDEEYRLFNEGAAPPPVGYIRYNREPGPRRGLSAARPRWTRIRIAYVEDAGALWYQGVEFQCPGVSALFAPVRAERAERAVFATWVLRLWLPAELVRRIVRLASRF